MNNWPEAVWIVKSLQKNFDYSSEIVSYTNTINNLNSSVNRLTTLVYDRLLPKKMAFIGSTTVGMDTFANDSIWFRLEGEN